MSCGVGCRHGSDPCCCGSGVGRRLQLRLDPSLGTSICCMSGPRKGKKTKKKKITIMPRTSFFFFSFHKSWSNRNSIYFLGLKTVWTHGCGIECRQAWSRGFLCLVSLYWMLVVLIQLVIRDVVIAVLWLWEPWLWIIFTDCRFFLNRVLCIQGPEEACSLW